VINRYPFAQEHKRSSVCVCVCEGERTVVNKVEGMEEDDRHGTQGKMEVAERRRREKDWGSTHVCTGSEHVGG